MTLEQMRVQSGLKAYKIAEMLGVSRVQYKKYETGRANMKLSKVEKLAKVFNVDPLKIYEALEKN